MSPISDNVKEGYFGITNLPTVGVVPSWAVVEEAALHSNRNSAPLTFLPATARLSVVMHAEVMPSAARRVAVIDPKVVAYGVLF